MYFFLSKCLSVATCMYNVHHHLSALGRKGAVYVRRCLLCNKSLFDDRRIKVVSPTDHSASLLLACCCLQVPIGSASIIACTVCPSPSPVISTTALSQVYDSWPVYECIKLHAPNCKLNQILFVCLYLCQCKQQGCE